VLGESDLIYTQTVCAIGEEDYRDKDVLIIALIQSVVILLWLMVGYLESMSILYYIGVMMAALLVLYQIVLIRDRNTERCFKAFLNNNYLGLVIFVGVIIHYA